MPDSKIPSQGHSQFMQFSLPITPGDEFSVETDKGNLFVFPLSPFPPSFNVKCTNIYLGGRVWAKAQNCQERESHIRVHKNCYCL